MQAQTATGALTLRLDAIDATQVALAGGKGANLGELTHVPGVRVPPGFCVTTAVLRRVMEDAPGLAGPLQRLAGVRAEDRDGIARWSAAARRAIEAAGVPDDAAAAIVAALSEEGADAAYAVRSSATAEDLPSASFAGQQDSFLGVVGAAAVLEHVSRCWASLFTARAVAYRRRQGLDDRQVGMAVVVQRMVPAEASGVLFTADPRTSDRRTSTVEAVRGLGEGLVSGAVTPDGHAVRDGAVVQRTAAGTDRVLTDAQAVALAALGRRIEAHFGAPQDIEWCLADDEVHVVQSRPITTLFPVPDAGDGFKHVFVSVGHQQMMTDPMRALGLSLQQAVARPVMHAAAGRVFVDVFGGLSTPGTREAVLQALGASDPLTGDALQAVLDDGDFVGAQPGDGPAGAVPPPHPELLDPDPAIVAELVADKAAANAAVARAIAGRTGAELVDFVVADVAELKEDLADPRSRPVYMTAMDASAWLNEHMALWLGEKGVADVLTQSVPDNVTSQMGLALLDVADVIRPHPAVAAHLEQATDDGLLSGLDTLEGGPQVRAAIEGFLAVHGMRCPGELDITRPRWAERPAAVVALLLANVRAFAPGEAGRRFERGRAAAAAKERDLLQRLRALPDGEAKAAQTKLMIDRVRTFIGYREHPKYAWMGRYLVYKQALMGEADRLVAAGVLADRDDLLHLTLEELRVVVRTHAADAELIAARRRAHRDNGALTPPRVITSAGHVPTPTYHRDDVPAGALPGLPVSSGVAEGRARVVLDVADADLEPGDILVTVGTDPSWTPLFLAAAALVTEVGGLMTHGAVIAREYGLPAVVAVQDATRLIPDGRRIRVHGTEGWVELLP